MKMESFPTCMICGQTGRIRYTDLPDRLFGILGRFQFRECPWCRLLWIDPRPSLESIGECYRHYYTHEELPSGGEQARPFAELRDRLREAILCGYFGYRHLHRDHRLCRVGGFLGRVHPLRYRAVFDDLAERFPAFTNRPDNLLIDVGCGRGDFLVRMKSLGWNVLGIEPDPVSSEIARIHGIPVFNGSLEQARLAGDTADEISLNHVLEHIHDPLELLRECYRVLRPGGRLVLYLPNIESLGHRFFGRHWAGLDPPRHLFHYSPRSIDGLLRQIPFRRCRIRTVGKISTGMYDTSLAIRENNLKRNEEAPQRRGRLVFRMIERLFCSAGFPCGEEIEVVAVK